MMNYCTTIPYIFVYDYTTQFFDFQNTTNQEKDTIKWEFICNLEWLLEKLHIKPANPIATALYERMRDDRLHYNTPIHILSILKFVTIHSISLAWWEELAIWFHAAIHVPGAKEGMNEWASSKFFESNLGQSINSQKLNWITQAIIYMGNNANPNVPEKYNLLMDLDMCFLTWNNPGRITALYMMGLEQPNATAIMSKLNFLQSVKSKGNVFRTKFFKQYTKTASDYIDDQIERLKLVVQEKPVRFPVHASATISQ